MSSKVYDHQQYFLNNIKFLSLDVTISSVKVYGPNILTIHCLCSSSETTYIFDFPRRGRELKKQEKNTFFFKKVYSILIMTPFLTENVRSKYLTSSLELLCYCITFLFNDVRTALAYMLKHFLGDVDQSV